MSPEFYQTQIGRRFIEGTMPKIADALERIARSMETPVSAHVRRDQVDHIFDIDEQLGSMIGEKAERPTQTSIPAVDSMSEAFEQMRRHGLIPVEDTMPITALRALRDDATDAVALIGELVARDGNPTQQRAFSKLVGHLATLYSHE